MSNGNDSWGKVATYVDTMTDLAVDAVKEQAGRLGVLWNKVGDKEFGVDDILEATQKTAGAVFHYTAKAWVETRDLMEDLADGADDDGS